MPRSRGAPFSCRSPQRVHTPRWRCWGCAERFPAPRGRGFTHPRLLCPGDASGTRCCCLQMSDTAPRASRRSEGLWDRHRPPRGCSWPLSPSLPWSAQPQAAPRELSSVPCCPHRQQPPPPCAARGASGGRTVQPCLRPAAVRRNDSCPGPPQDSPSTPCHHSPHSGYSWFSPFLPSKKERDEPHSPQAPRAALPADQGNPATFLCSSWTHVPLRGRCGPGRRSRSPSQAHPGGEQPSWAQG